MSPTDSTRGAFVSSGHKVSIVFAQRKYVARRNTNASFFIRLCLYLMSAATTAHCLASQAS
jgi:hypothetical protein